MSIRDLLKDFARAAQRVRNAPLGMTVLEQPPDAPKLGDTPPSPEGRRLLDNLRHGHDEWLEQMRAEVSKRDGEES